jgi:hypothetical protein
MSVFLPSSIISYSWLSGLLVFAVQMEVCMTTVLFLHLTKGNLRLSHLFNYVIKHYAMKVYGGMEV